MLLQAVGPKRKEPELSNTSQGVYLISQLLELPHGPPSNDPDIESSLPHLRLSDDGLRFQRNYISMTAMGGLLSNEVGRFLQLGATSCLVGGQACRLRQAGVRAGTTSCFQRQVVTGLTLTAAF